MKISKERAKKIEALDNAQKRSDLKASVAKAAAERTQRRVETAKLIADAQALISKLKAAASTSKYAPDAYRGDGDDELQDLLLSVDSFFETASLAKNKKWVAACKLMDGGKFAAAKKLIREVLESNAEYVKEQDADASAPSSARSTVEKSLQKSFETRGFMQHSPNTVEFILEDKNQRKQALRHVQTSFPSMKSKLTERGVLVKLKAAAAKLPKTLKWQTINDMGEVEISKLSRSSQQYLQRLADQSRNPDPKWTAKEKATKVWDTNGQSAEAVRLQKEMQKLSGQKKEIEVEDFWLRG